MQSFPCQIFPKSGYKNEQFLIRNHESTHSFNFTLTKDGANKFSGQVNNVTHLVLQPLLEAGMYQFNYQFENQQYTEHFEVKDAIRLGSSVVKALYVFEDIATALFVMKDRIKCYDEKNNYFFEENRFSPSNIIQIDHDHLLMVSQIGFKDEITNYALYSLSKSDIIFELKDKWRHLNFDPELKRLWVIEKDKNELQCYSFIGAHFPEDIRQDYYAFDKFELLSDEKEILLTKGDQLRLFGLNENKKTTIATNPCFAVDLKNETSFEIKETNLVVRDIFNMHKPFEIIPPEDFNVNELAFNWLGDKFPHSTAEDGLQNALKNILEAVQPDKTINQNYQSVQLPEEITEIEYKTIAYRPLRCGISLLMVRHTATRRLNKIIHRKDKLGIWSSEPEITATHVYELFEVEDNYNKISATSAANFEHIATFDDHVLLKNVSDVLLFKNGSFVHTYTDLYNHEITVQTFGGYQYLFSAKRNELSIFHLEDNYAAVILKTIVLNPGQIDLHQKIFFYTSQDSHRFLEGFDLSIGKYLNLKHNSLWQQGKNYKFENQYYKTPDGIYIDPWTLEKKGEVFGDFVTASRNLNKVITKRGDEIYLSQYQSLLKIYLVNEIELSSLSYDEAFLSPDGKYLVLQNETNHYALYDVASNKEINFFSGKFLAFNKDGSMVVEPEKYRAAVVYDPLTLQEITPAHYQYYQFKSPDGELYADLQQSYKFHHRIRNTYISPDEYKLLNAELGNAYTNLHHSTSLTIKRNREQYFLRHKEALKAINILTPESLSAETLIRKDFYINIGICGTDAKTEIPFPQHLGYYNYSAFSADNRYFGYVGKPHVRGHICIYEIEYDKVLQKIRLLTKYSSDYPAFASWVCAFSKANIFATYDSTPDTYLIGVEKLFQKQPTDEELSKNNFQLNPGSVFAHYKSWKVIKRKSFVCFSPTGNLMVLSEQGYEPLTLGGYGHTCSCAVHIVDSRDGRIIKSFLDHGAPLEKHGNYQKLTFAAFSEDENQLMTLSSDGVVLVRNIEELKTKPQFDISPESAVIYDAKLSLK